MQKKAEPTRETDGNGGAAWDVDVFRQNTEAALECSFSARDGPTMLRCSINSVTSTSLCDVLKEAIRWFGIPKTVRTDAGMQYCGDLDEFLHSHGIEHQIQIPSISSKTGHRTFI